MYKQWNIIIECNDIMPATTCVEEIDKVAVNAQKLRLICITAMQCCQLRQAKGLLPHLAMSGRLHKLLMYPATGL